MNSRGYMKLPTNPTPPLRTHTIERKEHAMKLLPQSTYPGPHKRGGDTMKLLPQFIPPPHTHTGGKTHTQRGTRPHCVDRLDFQERVSWMGWAWKVDLERLRLLKKVTRLYWTWLNSRCFSAYYVSYTLLVAWTKSGSIRLTLCENVLFHSSYSPGWAGGVGIVYLHILKQCHTEIKYMNRFHIVIFEFNIAFK